MSAPGAPSNLSSDPSATQAPQASTAISPSASEKPAGHQDVRQLAPEVSDTATETAPPQKTQNASGGHPAAAAAGSPELARAKTQLMAVLRRFPDFPIPGILFVDIMPLF